MYLLLLFSIGLFRTCSALAATPAGTLPEKRFEIIAVYDNTRYIYLLGGMSEQNNGVAEILRYDIYNETISVVGEFPQGLSQGSAHYSNDGSIFYLGGEYGNPSEKVSTIWKFDTSYEIVNPVRVGDLPHGIASHCSAYDGHNTFLVQGGYTNTFHDQLYSFDTVRNTSYAFTLANPTQRTSAACALVNDSTFLFFGGWEDGFQNTVAKYDLATGSKTVVDSTFQFGITGSVAVEVGNLVYVIGGGNGEPEVFKHHLSTFDWTSEELVTVEVSGMRTNLYRAGVVYVPNLNRIYVFGGREYGTEAGTETVNEIFYISL